MSRRALLAAVVAAALSTSCTALPWQGDRQQPAAPAPAGAIQPDPSIEGAGDPLFPDLGNGGYDIAHYDLDLTWTPSTQTLSGTATLTATTTRRLSTFYLDFAGMDVDTVTVDRRPAQFRRDGEELLVAPPKTLAARGSFQVAVTYHGTPEALSYEGVRSTNRLGWFTTSRTTYTTQEPYGAHSWYPCSDHPSDKATYTIHVTAPSALAVIANGRRTERRSIGASTRWTYTEPAPMASYLVTLAIGTYTIRQETSPRGLPLTFAYFPGDEAKVLPLLHRSAAQIAYFESRFGPYPFASYGVLVTDVSDDQTMETQTMVTLGRGLATDTSRLYPRGSGPTTLAHELAHQWFGDAVSPTRWTDMWLNEGWAMYSEWLYDNDVLHQSLNSRLSVYRLFDRRLRQVFGPPGKPTAENLTGDQVYIGPALMLNGLRRQMGDRAFFAMARAWVHENLGQSRSRADFTRYVNRFAGRDMSGYVAAWLDSTTEPGS